MHCRKLWVFLFSLSFISVLSAQSKTHHPQAFLKGIKPSKQGEAIYQHFCANCHAEKPLIPLGAPRIQHKSDWENRLKQPFDVIFEKVSLGFNAMPARGGCFECSDSELKEAIIYLLPRR